MQHEFLYRSRRGNLDALLKVFVLCARLQPVVHCQLKMERSVLAASHYIVLTIRCGLKLQYDFTGFNKTTNILAGFVFFKLPSFV